MEGNHAAEPAGRGIRAGVILATLAICVLLFWGMKGAFTGGPRLDDQANPERKSSFSAIERAPAKPIAPTTASVLPPTNNATQDTVAPQPVASFPSPAVQPAEPAPPVGPRSSPLVAATVTVESNGAVSEFGIISGNVILQGVPEPERPILMDPNCGKLHRGTNLTTQFYVVSAEGGLADVFIHIVKGLENRTFLPPAQPLVLDQAGCVYVPYVAAAQVGQTIEVRNSDPVLHNVHPTPAVAGNAEYNKAQLPKAPPLLFRWDNPEVFLRFKCDVHPWMFSYIGLVNHPYFAVTDTNGRFTIQDVPPGSYKLELYHRKSGRTTKDVIVHAGHTTSVNARMQAAK